MLVPRSFKYSSSPPTQVNEQQTTLRNSRRNNLPAAPESKRLPFTTQQDPTHAQTTPDTMRPPSQPVDVPLPDRTRSSSAKTVGHAKGKAYNAGRRKQPTPEQHRSEALSPSVAALLAMTTIPRRPRQNRTRVSDKRQISIDELINEWRSDDRFGKSYDSSPLSILLDNAEDCEESRSPSYQSSRYSRPQYERSASSDSIPSLEADENSLLSFGSPATPDSIHSRKSSMTSRKESPRSQPIRESCIEDHPLKPALEVDEDDFTFTPDHAPTTPKSKSSFKSNLTTSLQALKALSPFGQRKSPSGTRRAANKPERGDSVSPLPDDVLWSHPFLFPRFSPEVRPDYKGTPTSAQRRYLNPTPLSFEEQEAPFQQALHAPYLAEQQSPNSTHGPTIQLQTYSRSGSRSKARNASSKKASSDVDADSELADDAALNAAVAAAAMRHREPRENSDFLRVVVLEMNMRREGKLEMGRARIWLPPRQSAEGDGFVVQQGSAKVPRRWVGVSAE